MTGPLFLHHSTRATTPLAPGEAYSPPTQTNVFIYLFAYTNVVTSFVIKEIQETLY